MNHSNMEMKEHEHNEGMDMEGMDEHHHSEIEEDSEIKDWKKKTYLVAFRDSDSNFDALGKGFRFFPRP